MLKIDIPASDVELLRHERYYHPHPRVQLKMDVLLLKAFGLPNNLISQITGVCGNTIREYWKQYKEGGIERLKEVKFHKPGSELQEHSDTIEEYLTDNPPSSISHAVEMIEKLTGIKRGETQIRKFLKSLKFKFIKTCSVPAKALTEEKKTNNVNFWKKTLNPD
jgi:transposase